jgi:hypothetical protein
MSFIKSKVNLPQAYAILADCWIICLDTLFKELDFWAEKNVLSSLDGIHILISLIHYSTNRLTLCQSALVHPVTSAILDI